MLLDAVRQGTSQVCGLGAARECLIDRSPAAKIMEVSGSAPPFSTTPCADALHDFVCDRDHYVSRLELRISEL
jgi:hypothetical protein